MKLNFKKIMSLMKPVILCSLATLGMYLALNVFISAFFNSGSRPEDRNVVPYYVFIQLFYFLSFYLIYVRKQCRESTKPLDNRFSLKEDIMTYFHTDGKYFAVIYLACAVIQEVCLLLGLGSITTIIGMFLPITFIIHTPILRSVIALVVLCTGSLFLVVFEHHRVYKYWNE